MNYKRFKKYIVVDKDNIPMTYYHINKNGGQFCYAHSEEVRRPHGLEIYTLKKAKELIQKSIEFRKARNIIDVGKQYFLMPVK